MTVGLKKYQNIRDVICGCPIANWFEIKSFERDFRMLQLIFELSDKFSVSLTLFTEKNNLDVKGSNGK